MFPLHHLTRPAPTPNNPTPRSLICTCRDGAACKSAGKHPRIEAWREAATTSSEQIDTWWREWPDANIGIATGAESGLLVVDVDPRNGGTESLAQVEAEFGPMPTTVCSRSGSGGTHLLIRHPGGRIRNRGGLEPGIDVKADGGYIVAPPSYAHVTGAPYAWVDGAGPDDLPLAVPPPWLLQWIQTFRSNGSTSGDTSDDPIFEGTRDTTLTSIAGRMRRSGLTAEEIFAALSLLNRRRCRPPLDDADVQRIATSVGRYASGTVPETEAVWPEPAPLPDGLLPVPPFDGDRLLPAAFASWVRDSADRIGCPPEYLAVTILSAASAVIGRRLSIFPLAEDRDWRVIPNTWAAVVGPPGAKKTPAQRAALKPFQRLHVQERQRYEQRVREFEAQEVALQAELDAVRKTIQKAAKDGEPTEPLQAQYTAVSARMKESAPRERRLSANDTTIEKLAVLLAENPTGIFVFRDELLGLIRSLDREGHEGDQAFFNEGWDGNYSSRVDRIGRGELIVPANCLTLCGGIPPEPLQAYLVEVQRKKTTNDGFISRFQLLVYPDLVTQSGVDRRPDASAADRVQQIFEALDRFTGVQLRAESGGGDEPPSLRFSVEAQQVFAAWRAAHETKVRAETEPLMQAHLAKYVSLVPSLALIVHVIERLDPEGPQPPLPGVSRPALERAILWCDFLEAHARRIFEAITAAPRFAAVALGRRIVKGEVPNGFQARKVHRKGWSRLTTPQDVAAALDVLEELGWVREEEILPGQKGGRPTRVWWVNPKLKRAAPTP